MTRPASRTPWAWLGLCLATFAAYWPALGGGFLWDDDAHVTKPALRSLSGLWRIWSEVGATQQYYPVLHSLFWFEHRLWGDAPLGYHLLNVFLHATAAALFTLVLRRLLSRWDIPLFAGFLFALHPVAVESVAWISEEKNTLSAVFYLWSALAYLRWRESARSHRYFLALGLFILALLSKSVTATLPAALLVVLWYQHGRLSWRRDVVPLLPWFALGGAAGLFTAWVERTYIGAPGADFSLSLLERGLLAGRVICFYLGKLLWPTGLIFVYPRWTIDPLAAWSYLFPLGVVAALAALWLLRRRSRAPLAVALLFVGTLFPALGFFYVYPFLFSYVADHFQYLASLGVIAGTAGGLAKLAVFPGRTARIAGGALVAVLGILTWRHCAAYRSAEGLYRASLEENPAAWMPQSNLANLLLQDGRFDEAIGHYRQALRLRSESPEIHFNLADALARARRLPEAVGEYEAALRLLPNYSDAEANLGTALVDLHRPAEAIPHFERALRFRPDLAQARYGLGCAWEAAGRLPEALAQFEEAVRLSPGYVAAHYRLANALGNSGRVPEAIVHYEAALRLRPDYVEAHADLGLALAAEDRLPEAQVQLARALELRPAYPEAHADLGFVLARSGHWAEAAGEYRTALRLKPDDADIHYQLGEALRAQGDAAGAAAEFATAERLSTATARP